MKTLEISPETVRTEAAPFRTRNIVRDVREGVCTLTFDRPGSAANVLDADVLHELDEHLDWIEHARELAGVIIASAKEKIFIAGADVHALANMANEASNHHPSGLADLISLGQTVFNRLENLAVPTVAAIHGACVGGGYELALACRYRIASDHKATRIGLPEVLLGIVPAWGGSTRLPRLIGIPKALQIILGGKTPPAATALQLGLIDEVVPREQLLDMARARLVNPVTPHRARTLVANNPISVMLIRNRVTKDLVAKTRGNYPAAFEALDLVTHAVSLPTHRSLAREREAILRLSDTETCRNLLGLFLAKEKARKGGRSCTISRSAVVGAGVMGAGIAQWLSARGMSVILRDVGLDQLVRGMATVSSLYEDAVRRHLMSPIEAREGKDRIFPAATDLPMRDVEIVIEAATEKLPVKQDIFRCLAAQSSPNAILATNTSALSVSEIASAISTPERVVGLHFFNPVHRMELVEVIPAAQTAPEVLARAIEFTRRIGKVPVVARDSPGFIVNRILMPYLVEAVRLLDLGASALEMDEAMLDFGMPMGPLRLLDEVGLDVAAQVIKTLESHFADRVSAPSLIPRMLGAGMLGRKSGRGFYEYAQNKPNQEIDVLRSVHRHTHHTRDELVRRMSLLMVNEAARCVEEQVATANDVDLAMVLGAGFAPFRGGPLRYADALSARTVVMQLEHLAATEPRFAPCALLKQMSRSDSSFHDTLPSAANEKGTR